MWGLRVREGLATVGSLAPGWMGVRKDCRPAQLGRVTGCMLRRGSGPGLSGSKVFLRAPLKFRQQATWTYLDLAPGVLASWSQEVVSPGAAHLCGSDAIPPVLNAMQYAH